MLVAIKYGFGPARITLATLVLMFVTLTMADPARAQVEHLDAGVVKLDVKTDSGQNRVGSGFIVRCDNELAYILTAFHVVRDSRETGVLFDSRRRAKPVSPSVIDQQYWNERGLALLSVPAEVARSAGARALPLRAARFPAKGQKLRVIGHPRTVSDWLWLEGPVAGRKGELYRVQVRVQEGNSGGPVLLDGEVVGIVLNELGEIADVKPATDIREYLDDHYVIPAGGACPGGDPQTSASRPTAVEPPESAPALAKLTVRSNVHDDLVYIDGKRYGPTRLDVELPPGFHVVRVEKEDHEPWEKTVELRVGEEKTVRATLQRLGPKPGETFRDCDDCPEMVVIPAGSFQMGSPAGEQGHDDDEGPVHRVRIAEPFALARREVTVGYFRAFVDASGYRTEAEKGEGCAAWDGSKWAWDAKRTWRAPGFPQRDDHPVVCVSWNDAKAYLGWLGKEAGQSYRLPSEAEWEYAARAGSKAARFWGKRADQACDFANVADNAGKKQYNNWTDVHDCNDKFVYTAPVGTYKANAFGLLDMLGNVWEWTEDCYNDAYNGAPSDGSAWTKGDCRVRVLRGGSWDNDPGLVRSAIRYRNGTVLRNGGVGFRPARTL